MIAYTGDRAKEGSVGDAVDQLDSIQERQKRSRQGIGRGIVNSTGKSEQRVRDALNRIKDRNDASDNEDDHDPHRKTDDKPSPQEEQKKP
jgi:hypothetical protein